MKKLIVYVLGAFLATGTIFYATDGLFSTEKTATVSKKSYQYMDIYTYSFTTALSTADTVKLVGEKGKPIDISAVTSLSDKISLFATSSETSLDSIRHTIEWQVSYKHDPSTAIANTSDWFTVETESGAGAALDSIKTNIMYMTPATYGHPKWLRVLVRESSTAKDASQTISAYLSIPKPPSWKH